MPELWSLRRRLLDVCTRGSLHAWFTWTRGGFPRGVRFLALVPTILAPAGCRALFFWRFSRLTGGWHCGLGQRLLDRPAPRYLRCSSFATSRRWLLFAGAAFRLTFRVRRSCAAPYLLRGRRNRAWACVRARTLLERGREVRQRRRSLGHAPSALQVYGTWRDFTPLGFRLVLRHRPASPLRGSNPGFPARGRAS